MQSRGEIFPLLVMKVETFLLSIDNALRKRVEIPLINVVVNVRIHIAITLSILILEQALPSVRPEFRASLLPLSAAI